jgi:beta-galactosidase
VNKTIGEVGSLDRGRHKTAGMSRREFVRNCAAGATALVSGAALLVSENPPTALAVRQGSASGLITLNEDWLFGGRSHDAALRPAFDDANFERGSLPHCVVKLSWQYWNPEEWEAVWIYRRHFTLPQELHSQRIFLHFDGVMVGATPVINGHALPKHLGGYLPFQYEITDVLAAGENVLAVVIDSRWSNTPPEGSPRGPKSIDYLEPGGIPRSVSLRLVPQVFISDVFAKPVNVLEDDRRVDVACTIDASILPRGPVRIEAALLDGSRVVTCASQSLRVEKPGRTDVALTLANIGNVRLWDVNAPKLHCIRVALYINDRQVHEYRTRIGFRDARFTNDGFYLNGRRLQIFGLDRHELYPYRGFAMPPRVLRRDAELLRHTFNCNFVRCSHYPQSEAFIEACDELGLMIWEELPGWQYLGDAAWKERGLRDVQEMVRRDRNHPAVVVWGVRINESANDLELYRKTKAAADALDGSRPTSGTMTRHSTNDWLQDVFAYDDYHARPDGSADIAEPLPDVPYFVTEAVGQFNYAKQRGFDAKYRRAGDVELQMSQAILHAQAHDRAAAYPRMGGVIAWCAFDYGSLMNSYDGVKCPGIADVFRIPKLGASFYMAQVDPNIRPLIEPNFYWDFGPHTPSGPGKNAAIFSNCDRLELFINSRRHATLRPDHINYPHTTYPPFFTDLSMDGAGKPDLRIDGYVGQTRVLTRHFSSDPATDRLLLSADSHNLVGDGIDAVRLEFKAVDRYGAPRPFVGGEVEFKAEGPGVIVGDNPFQWATSGGVGAVWVKSTKHEAGHVKVTATHSSLGHASVEIEVSSPSSHKEHEP